MPQKLKEVDAVVIGVLPGRGPTGQVAVNITGVTIMLTVSDQNVSLVVDSRELRVGD